VIVAVPGVIGVTIPEVIFTVATSGEVVLVQVPPVVGLLNVMFIPTHVGVLPVIAGGRGLTVTILVTLHPTPNMYETIEVPVLMPDTIPEASIVAIDKFVLLHVPPPVVVDSVAVPPTHALPEPVIAPGSACTVSTVEAIQPVGSI